MPTRILRPQSVPVCRYDGTQASVFELLTPNTNPDVPLAARWDAHGNVFDFADIKPKLTITRLNDSNMLVIEPGTDIMALGSWYVPLTGPQVDALFYPPTRSMTGEIENNPGINP